MTLIRKTTEAPSGYADPILYPAPDDCDDGLPLGPDDLVQIKQEYFPYRPVPRESFDKPAEAVESAARRLMYVVRDTLVRLELGKIGHIQAIEAIDEAVDIVFGYVGEWIDRDNNPK